jgi:outer membrane receptor protein involved in Fe transport
VNSSIIGRVYGRYQLNEAIALHARIENVNDEEYDLFNSGFGTTQGPGLGLFAGLTATF